MELVIVLIWIILCPIFCGIVANKKGRNVGGWVVIGFVLGIFGLIWILLLSPNQQVVAANSLQARETKRCPHCAEHIRFDTNVCRYCGRSLTAQGDTP